MSILSISRTAAAALAACVATVALAQGAGDSNSNGGDHGVRGRHVLLISIDGMHAVDFRNCIGAGTCPNLAALGQTGVTYTGASTSKPSDSFPGLMSIVTGASPKLMGIYYDVAYDRVLAPPTVDTGNGLLHGTCAAGQPNGTRTEYEEGDEFDQTHLNGVNDGTAAYGRYDGTIQAIDPQKLVRDPYQNCAPVWPWNFVRTNTIFGVIHAAGGFTAWSDKHPVYAAVSGPTGTTVPSNLDDFYGPEINSNVINLPGVKTAEGLDCSTIPNNNGGDYTTDFDDIKCYDQLKVNAVLHWINGQNHLGTASAKVPNIFGMNFQAVSVGEKLIETINGQTVKGGYLDGAATPSDELEGEIRFVDGAIGQFVQALRANHLYGSTTIIITAKHGQSPIDPNRFFPIPGHSHANGSPPSGVLGPDYLPDSELNQIGPTEDDVSLLWLKPGVSTTDAVSLLESNASAIGLGQIIYGPQLAMMFNQPGLPADGGDSRTPDIIVTPNIGVVYTGSLAKQSEHGGFALDDTNVMLLVSSPSLRAHTVTTAVTTSEVAPTILMTLGLDPEALDGVRKEGTPVLPDLGLNDHD
ncbi:MAG TPA: alkaline phosphatase family protein [Steroidobacteraceae bacterium]|nr:alkaline phosphatase family protein [Steroidobacteraceae bacterium]